MAYFSGSNGRTSKKSGSKSRYPHMVRADQASDGAPGQLFWQKDKKRAYQPERIVEQTADEKQRSPWQEPAFFPIRPGKQKKAQGDGLAHQIHMVGKKLQGNI